ncbi:MAG TPA: NAD-binding protein [Capsulimonadaceae bacterium]|jgi:Trk K+ transport system NAD-binding subunit
MLTDKRFVIAGLSRLSVRVAGRLVRAHGRVVVIRSTGEGEGLLRLLPDGVDVVTAEPELEYASLAASELPSAHALLALGDDDVANLRAAVAAKDIAPDTPVALRTFDPALADQLEEGLNIRRAYSVSSLAAPAFIAAACGDSVFETLRLGNGEAPIASVTVKPGSPLVGLTAARVKELFGCAVLGRCHAAGSWTPASADDAPLAGGDQVLIGAPLYHVLRLVCVNAGWSRLDGKRPRNKVQAPRRRKRGRRRLTQLPYVAAGLGLVMLLAVAVFSRAMHLSFVDAVYFVVTTATTTGYGDISLKDSPDWLKLFGCGVMVAGGALLGVLFSYFASVATTERIEEWMGRRAEKMAGHVVVAGLGNLGYRISRLLLQQGLDVAVIELSPRDRFVEAIRQRAPVLTGDARLPENLERASTRTAAAFIGGTTDDMVNILACLQARRMNPNITTVARIFDDSLADRLAGAFAISSVLSASECAAGAFVGAATDESAVRTIHVGNLVVAAARYTATLSIGADAIGGWRESGVRIVAFSTDGTALAPPSELPRTCPAGAQFILCGPLDAVRGIVDGG